MVSAAFECRDLRIRHVEVGSLRIVQRMRPYPLRSMSTGHEAWRTTGHPAEEIVALADREQVDAIIMGTHGLSGVEMQCFGAGAGDTGSRSQRW